MLTVSSYYYNKLQLLILGVGEGGEGENDVVCLGFYGPVNNIKVIFDLVS